jgi:TfoX/Sxy family transcriptional regulator of competence genes
MSEVIKDNRFVFTVLQSLEPMGKIDCLVVDSGTLGLYKDNIMFGYILGSELYLRTTEGNQEIYEERLDMNGAKFNKLRKNYLHHKDILLQIATESYWIATGKR